MKITNITKIITHSVSTDDGNYRRYFDGSWMEDICYDVMVEEHPIGLELQQELEELFQIEQGYIPMSESQCNKLWDADPNCVHVHDPHCWSGIKCCKCGGWYCL
jgi:hypothetical protein